MRGEDQQLHSFFPLDLNMKTRFNFFFYCLSVNVLNFTFIIFMTFNSSFDLLAAFYNISYSIPDNVYGKLWRVFLWRNLLLVDLNLERNEAWVVPST